MLNLAKIKSNFSWLILLFTGCAISCTSHSLFTKAWHTSPSDHPFSSTIYPDVDWFQIQKINPGFSTIEAKKILRDVQYYHHPINANAYTSHQGKNYEVAFKLSSDQKTIEDISYKFIPTP